MDFFSPKKMKEISITSSFTIYDNIDELPQDIQDLMSEAVEIRKKRMLRILNLKLEPLYYLIMEK